MTLLYIKVFKASMRLPDQGDASVLVAMKHLRGVYSDEQRTAMLQEACLLAQFKHPSIVEVLGVSITSAGVILLTSFCENGDLLNFLRRRRGFIELAFESRCRILNDVATGMVSLDYI